MFNNNISGNKNRIKINQKNGESNKIIVDIVVGIIVTVIGGIILYFIIALINIHSILEAIVSCYYSKRM